MTFNDIEVSALALGTALHGRKIEAIKLVRDMSGAGLRDAKDAVEAAMAAYEPSYASSELVAGLQQQLADSRRIRVQDADVAAAEHMRLREANATLLARLRLTERRLNLAEQAITDHIFGRTHLPDLGIEPGPDMDYAESDGDMPF